MHSEGECILIRQRFQAQALGQQSIVSMSNVDIYKSRSGKLSNGLSAFGVCITLLVFNGPMQSMTSPKLPCVFTLHQVHPQSGNV